MKKYVFKQGFFTIEIPAKDEAEARTLLPDPDYGRWTLVEETSIESDNLRKDKL